MNEPLPEASTGQWKGILSPSFIQLGADIRAKLRDDYDVMGVISGREGIGKTTFGYWLCRVVDPAFDVEKNIVYNLEQMKDKIFNTSRYCSNLMDEGMEIFYKRNWFKADQKRLNQILGMARQNNLFYVSCAPRFTDLDEYLRNWRIRLWVHVVDRGVGLVHFRDDGEHQGDPWHLGDKAERRTRNYWDRIECGPMPKEDHDRYIALKRAYFEEVGKANGDGAKNGKKPQKGLLTLGQLAQNLRTKRGISYADLGALSGIDPSYLRVAASAYRRSTGLNGIRNEDNTDENAL